MSISSVETRSRPDASRWFALPHPYLWVHVVVAGMAMVATMPGRTHGLGLITEPLLRELQIDRLQYASINLWATLLGALFCLPCGWLLDRLGPRVVLTGISLSLGAVVLVMSQIQADWWVGELQLPWMSAATSFAFGLFFLVLLTRGLGQSALSVASLALIGKSVGRGSALAYGVYSFVVAAGFMTAFALCRYSPENEWRMLWMTMGWALVGFAVLVPLVVRPALLAHAEPAAQLDGAISDVRSYSLGEALRTRTFWVFAFATSFYGAIASGISLFNQSILQERGFSRDIFLKISAAMPIIGLAANLGTGWLATRWSMGRLLAGSMFVLAAALFAFPHVESLTHVYMYAVAMGIAGGMVTVLFFGIWSKAFGTAQLGRIQGMAQMMTVLASAAGPVVLAWSKETYGSYTPLFQATACGCGALMLIAWFTPSELAAPVRDEDSDIDVAIE